MQITQTHVAGVHVHDVHDANELVAVVVGRSYDEAELVGILLIQQKPQTPAESALPVDAHADFLWKNFSHDMHETLFFFRIILDEENMVIRRKSHKHLAG